MLQSRSGSGQSSASLASTTTIGYLASLVLPSVFPSLRATNLQLGRSNPELRLSLGAEL